MHCAAEAGHSNACVKLVELGADVNAVGKVSAAGYGIGVVCAVYVIRGAEMYTRAFCLFACLLLCVFVSLFAYLIVCLFLLIRLLVI